MNFFSEADDRSMMDLEFSITPIKNSPTVMNLPKKTNIVPKIDTLKPPVQKKNVPIGLDSPKNDTSTSPTLQITPVKPLSAEPTYKVQRQSELQLKIVLNSKNEVEKLATP